MGKPAPEPDSVLNGLPDSASEKSSEDSGQDLKGSSPPSTPERSRTGDLAAVLPTPEKAAALLAAKADADHEAYAEGTGVIAAPKAPLTPAASAAARPALSPVSPAPAAVLPKVASESSSTASTLERKAPATPATPQPEAPALAQPVPAFVAPPQPDVPAEAQAVAAFIWVNVLLTWPACIPCVRSACSEHGWRTKHKWQLGAVAFLLSRAFHNLFWHCAGHVSGSCAFHRALPQGLLLGQGSHPHDSRSTHREALRHPTRRR